MRMPLEGKNKRKKKGGAEERDDPDGGVRGNLTGDYVVGQVASSLFQGKRPCRDTTARLASLFSSLEPQPQPVYLRVPKETTKKRKRDEEEESTFQIQRPLLQEPSKKAKAKKKLSDADKKLANSLDTVDVLCQIPAEGTLSKKLAAIKRKIHPDQKNINAYVVFKDESAATKALKRNGAQIADGFRIRVDLASETSSRDKRSVFVGNLPYKVEESVVEEHFLDCGSIVAVRIVRDRATGIGRGFGYVLFENKDAVHLALKLNNSELMGRKLRVMRSVNKEKLKPSSNPSLKNVVKPKQGLNFASKNVGPSKSLFIGEKAVTIKKKKKGQKKIGQTKKQKKQK
ncbi:RNA-binding protein 34 [Leptonychotes weddellii]|uniref:RNA-binding protein 34 n=1 Tax=Leptonychotes weddellii TaxID=9713 RepID=A0A2U3YSS4_LEPWE|nr:RNA-binding protein 34 [Leptonychotes weddellii]